MIRSRNSMWRRAAVLAAALATVAACGSSSDSSGGGTTTPGSSGASETTAAGGTTAAPGATAAPSTLGPSGTEPQNDTGGAIKIGIITSTSGALKSYGEQYLDGLKTGLAYATDGTNALNGRPIEFVIKDDGGDPAKATSAATELVGNGVKVLAGTVSSSVAGPLSNFANENKVLYISGPAATDAVTGVNKYTFRSGRQTYQDVVTASSLIDGDSGSVLVLAQDNQFGQANEAAVKAVLGAKGFTVDSLLVPDSETEFTGYADQVNQKKPSLLFVAWAGETTGPLWQALAQQDVFSNTTVTTGLANKATWPFYGKDPSGIKFLNHYNPASPDNPVNEYMVKNATDADLFTPDGFVAAQMIVQALSQAGEDDVDAMVGALEGWKFDAPKGSQEIRASDHAMLQPMFAVSLTPDGEQFKVETIKTLDNAQTAPPEAGGGQ